MQYGRDKFLPQQYQVLFPNIKHAVKCACAENRNTELYSKALDAHIYTFFTGVLIMRLSGEYYQVSPPNQNVTITL